LLGGTVLVEYVFNWPGLSGLLVNAVEQRDYPMVRGVVRVISTVFVLLNLVIDILYAALDPRVSLWQQEQEGAKRETDCSERVPPVNSWHRLRAIVLTGPGIGALVLLFVALAAGWISPYDPGAMDIVNRLADPSSQYPLGRDEYGRDILSRLIHG